MSVKEKQQETIKNPIPAKQYCEAFVKLFKCHAKDFEMRPDWEEGPMLVKFKDKVYRIDSFYDIREYAIELLSSEDSAFLVPLDLWIEVAEGVHMETNFLVHFLSKLEESDYVKANLAFSASKIGIDPINAFWYSIYHIDDMKLYPKAVIAATETYNTETIIEELTSLLIENGEEHLNEMKDGIFEDISLDENKENELSFYIYSVDPVRWTA